MNKTSPSCHDRRGQYVQLSPWNVSISETQHQPLWLEGWAHSRGGSHTSLGEQKIDPASAPHSEPESSALGSVLRRLARPLSTPPGRPHALLPPLQYASPCPLLLPRAKASPTPRPYIPSLPGSALTRTSISPNSKLSPDLRGPSLHLLLVGWNV